MDITNPERKKKIEEKWTEPKESVEHYAIDQTCILGVSGEKRQGKEAERICEEIMAENSPNLMKYMNINIQEAQQIPRWTQSSTQRHIMIKLLKDKERI